MMSAPLLASHIQRLVADLPGETIAGLAAALQQVSSGAWPQLRDELLQTVSQPDVRKRVEKFLKGWQSIASEVSTESVALALLSAANVAEYHRQHQQLELVWTGPDTPAVPLRRTDQALLQLIQEAQSTLHIVSFAVYKVGKIADAIVGAAGRSVSIAIYLETPDASEGKMAFDTVQALGGEVASRAQIYIWPAEKRPLSDAGKHGSLHAKVALADSRTMLVSSANLTEYAMTLNMEMGLLVRGGPLPGRVEAHLTRLVEQKVFQRI